MEIRAQLRKAMELLASPAAAQVEWLDHIFSELTGGKSAEAYGNYELIEEFDGIAIARNHLVEIQKISNTEAKVIARLDGELEEICDASDDSFWERPALYDDPTWERIRESAQMALTQFPNEPRQSE